MVLLNVYVTPWFSGRRSSLCSSQTSSMVRGYCGLWLVQLNPGNEQTSDSQMFQTASNVQPRSDSPKAAHWVCFSLVFCLSFSPTNSSFKGSFELLEVCLYEIPIHSQCITYSRCWSAWTRFGETERSTCTEARGCTAVNRVSSESD